MLKVIHDEPTVAVKATPVQAIPSGALGGSVVYGVQKHAPLLEMTVTEEIVPTDEERSLR